MSKTIASPKIVEENIGEKVPFTIENDTWININDEFNINLAKKKEMLMSILLSLKTNMVITLMVNLVALM